MLTASGITPAEGRTVAFLFSGQGTQYTNMGFGLYMSQPVFREAMDRCSRVLGQLDEHGTLIDILYGGKESSRDCINQTATSQPALFALEYSLARLWESLGIKPVAVAGHSIGEYVAACEAGVFSLEDAIDLVRARGIFMQSMAPGAMLAVLRPEAEVRTFLPQSLDVAVVNSPTNCVVSGPIAEIDLFGKDLEARGISRQRLHTSHAFHSRMMDGVFSPLVEALRRVELRPPRIPVASNLSGEWLSDADATDPNYWAKHMRNTVQFGRNLLALAQRFNDTILLELGPGSTLCNIARQQPNDVRTLPSVPALRHARDDVADDAYLLRAIGALWCHGAIVNPSALPVFSTSQRRIALPHYPFEMSRSTQRATP